MSSEYNYNAESLFESEETDQQEIQSSIQECILFAVDCNPSMFEADKNSVIPIKSALEIIRDAILRKMQAFPNYMSGIVFYSTTKEENSLKTKSVYELHILDMADTARIKELDSFIQDISLIRENYGSEEEFAFGDLFWVLSSIFVDRAPKNSFKHLFVVTNQDKPNHGDKVLCSSSIQRAEDLSRLGVNIHIVGYNNFDPSFFYKDLSSSLKTVVCHTEVESFKNALDSLRAALRNTFRLPFKFSEKLTIGITGYSTIMEQKIPLPKYYHVDTLVKEAIRTTRSFCADTQRPLTNMDIKQSFEYGGEKVLFSKDELSAVANTQSPGLVLLGFKDLKDLRPHYQVSHPYFIQPNELKYKGSTALFYSLLFEMSEKKKIAICTFMKRANTTAKLVALVPQDELKNADGRQIEAPGFQIVILPYGDEIRSLPVSSTPEASPENVEEVKLLVNKLYGSKFNPTKYENPTIRNHHDVIRAIALEEPDFEVRPDTISFDSELMDEELMEINERIRKSMGLDNITEDELMFASNNEKRKLGANAIDAHKRAKSEGQTIEELWKENRLSKVTNQSLKDFLIENAIHPKKLKAALIEQVDEFLTKKSKAS
ncbi:SPOC like C-terminal domain-containing protein [Sporodiniella umbellata]|nr:SPOC like C-terminal domain-containing protein [Sporodiniella umbellata]